MLRRSEAGRAGGAPPALLANQQPGRVNPNRGKTFPVEVLSRGEVQAMLAACSTSRLTGIRNRALVALLYRSGLRISEALDLRPGDLDLERGAIVVLRGKGPEGRGKRRTVGIDAGALELVRQWLDARRRAGLAGHLPLFCTLEGRRMSSSSVRELLPRLADRAGVDKRVHAHGLRHTHAYELMLEGVPIAIIQKQLGHQYLATTARYVDHFAPEQLLRTIGAREWEPSPVDVEDLAA